MAFRNIYSCASPKLLGFAKYSLRVLAPGTNRCRLNLWRRGYVSNFTCISTSHLSPTSNALRRQLLFTCSRQRPTPLLVHSRSLFGMSHELTAVKTELDRISQGKDKETKTRQLDMFTSLTKDVSEPTITLVAKLNCETKLSPREVYELALAVLEASNSVAEGLYLVGMAANLFGYAGEQGDHNALYTYAQLLRTGQGVQADVQKAADIFNNLSFKGHPYAQYALGGMYYSGTGVEQSFQKAYTLYKVSAQNYIPQAYNILGNMHQHGQGVEQDIKMAVDFYQKGCELGDPHAHISMAQCYSHGKGVEQSSEKAFESYLEASKSNNPMALYNVATHYFSGLGVPQNMEKAKEYYEKAAILGFYPAQFNLGNMYYSGLGVAKDKEKAKELFRLAAESDESAKEVLKTIEEEERKEQQDQDKKS